MGVVIFIIVVVFLWWSLVPKKPKQPTFNDILNEAEKRQGKYSRVFQNSNKYAPVKYYRAKEPIDDKDKQVFSGTESECDRFISLRS